MIDYNVGDVVVMVRSPRYSFSEAPPKGKPVKAVRLRIDSHDEVVVLIDGYPSRHPTGEWLASHFRKLPRASDEFTQQMRALKPSKRKQPA